MSELFMFYAWKVAPTMATILITIAYLPQIIKIKKTRSVKDISLGFWIMINLFLVNMWVNSIAVLMTTDRLGYFITESINFALALVVLIQIIFYSRKGIK